MSNYFVVKCCAALQKRVQVLIESYGGTFEQIIRFDIIHEFLLISSF